MDFDLSSLKECVYKPGDVAKLIEDKQPYFYVNKASWVDSYKNIIRNALSYHDVFLFVESNCKELYKGAIVTMWFSCIAEFNEYEKIINRLLGLDEKGISS